MFFKLTFWLSLLQLYSGVSGGIQGKIIAGYTAFIDDYPFLVNVVHGRQFICGGALISPSCVVTAAHCLENCPQNVQNLFITTNQQCIGKPVHYEQVRQAWFTFVYPQYTNDNMDGDVAVIKMREPFDTSTNVSIAPIDFNEVPDGADLRIVGWGQTSFNKQIWNQCLQAADINQVPSEQCSQLLGPPYSVTNNMLCALGANNTDTCKGDSGGPIMYNDRVVGVVSWGIGCGQGIPGIYTRFSSSQMAWFLKRILETYCFD